MMSEEVAARIEYLRRSSGWFAYVSYEHLFQCLGPFEERNECELAAGGQIDYFKRHISGIPTDNRFIGTR